MNEKTRAYVLALFWTVMAAAILAILLLPPALPPTLADLGIVKPATPATLVYTDLTWTSVSDNEKDNDGKIQ